MIRVDSISARAGNFRLRDVSLQVPRGAWGIVLGPAGAGKTTLLECIAGVRQLTSGRVILRDRDMTRAAPEARRVGLVHQHGYLFPHLSVLDNVAYGAADLHSPTNLLARLGGAHLGARAVASLSGGERQVVALARALAAGPGILLLDEPFAALDPRSRVRLRSELRRLQRELELTVLHVTHDFIEAGMLGDVAVVLTDGAVAQSGKPEGIFRVPVSREVADFLGFENILGGVVSSSASPGDEGITTLTFVGEGVELTGVGNHPGGSGHAVIRAEDIVLARSIPASSSARNVLAGTIVGIAPDGVLTRVTLSVRGATLTALVTTASALELSLAPAESVTAIIKATAVHLC